MGTVLLFMLIVILSTVRTLAAEAFPEMRNGWKSSDGAADELSGGMGGQNFTISLPFLYLFFTGFRCGG